MELSSQDNLRLNVLLAQQPRVIRIDESRLSVHALTATTEISLQLHPNCRNELYVRRVRELLSNHALGSPEGYPLYIRRWTRMGQARSRESLAQLLLLGEPEAVAAVVHAPELDPELAQRAWWAAPEVEHARCLLSHPHIAAAPLGQELAQFLLEYLPFEADALSLAESVRLLLHSGLLDEATRLALWRKGRHKHAYYLGFMSAMPDNLPDSPPARPDAAALYAVLDPMHTNPAAAFIRRLVSPQGQNFILSAEHVLRKAQNQEIINHWLELIAAYFQPMRLNHAADLDLAQLHQALAHSERPPQILELSHSLPLLNAQLESMSLLAGLSYAVVRPIFSRSDATGSLMRRKLEPVTTPLLTCLHSLRQPLSC
jgi:hypothetical protein